MKSKLLLHLLPTRLKALETKSFSGEQHPKLLLPVLLPTATRARPEEGADDYDANCDSGAKTATTERNAATTSIKTHIL